MATNLDYEYKLQWFKNKQDLEQFINEGAFRLCYRVICISAAPSLDTPGFTTKSYEYLLTYVDKQNMEVIV